jgi:hypothetical protein
VVLPARPLHDAETIATLSDDATVSLPLDPNAELEQFRAMLAVRIVNALDAQKLTGREAAERNLCVKEPMYR